MARHEAGYIILQNPLGHYEETVGTSPVGLPGYASVLASVGSMPERIRRVVIRNNGQPMTWTDDDTTPTDSHGMVALADEVLVYDGASLDQLSFIRSSTATADVDLRVAYYGI